MSRKGKQKMSTSEVEFDKVRRDDKNTSVLVELSMM